MTRPEPKGHATNAEALGGDTPSSSTTEDKGPPRVPVNLLQPASASQRKRASKSARVFRTVRSAFRSFPILAPTCRFPTGIHVDGHHHGATRMTGTLFGHRKARATLSVQDNPRSLPILILELAIPTGKLLQEMGSGLVRVSLECEKKAAADRATRLLEEPLWTMFCNGRKLGYSAKREPTEADLAVMQLLHAVSMGAGVLPSDDSDGADGELTYMRAHFDRVVGSRDSETFYMLNPDGNTGPELSIFFVRI